MFLFNRKNRVGVRVRVGEAQLNFFILFNSFFSFIGKDTKSASPCLTLTLLIDF